MTNIIVRSSNRRSTNFRFLANAPALPERIGTDGNADF
jgi:hypothetical protein